jgi:hypothetical protein
MKTYLSRSEAVKKYNVSMAKLRGWEKKGKLHRVDTYRTDRESNRAGAPVQWVYDEEELEALTKMSALKPSVPRNLERKIFTLLVKGLNVIDIVHQTKLPVHEVQRIRDIYANETGGMFLSGNIIKEVRHLGFMVDQPGDFPRVMGRLLAAAREQNRLLDLAERSGFQVPRK